MDQVARLRAADDFVRRFAAALRAAQLYAPSHPLVQRAFDSLNEALTQLLTDQPTIAIGIIGQEIIVGDVPLPRAAESMGEMIRRLKSLGIERIAFDRGVDARRGADAGADHRASGAPAGTDRRPASNPPIRSAVLNSLPHIRVGRIQTEEKKEASAADIATIRRLYADATNVAGTVWEIAQDRRHARSEGGARAGRFAGAGGVARTAPR